MEFGGITRQVQVDFVAEAQVGEYMLVDEYRDAATQGDNKLDEVGFRCVLEDGSETRGRLEIAR